MPVRVWLNNVQRGVVPKMADGPSLTHRLRIGSRLVAIAALVAALLSAVLVGGGRSAADVSGVIAFTRADGIYVMRSDGSSVRPLLRGGPAAGVVALAWSPDGARLAFVNQERNELWAMDADGSRLVRLAVTQVRPGDFLCSVTWSRDGRSVAYTSRSGDDRDVWLVDADGANRQPLVRTRLAWELEVDWNPTRDRIAFTDARGMVLRVYVMDANGKHLRPVSSGWPVQSAMPSWSPDGRKLAFMRFRDLRLPSDAEIWVTDMNGPARRLTRNTVADSNPTWSPDGRKLAFIRGRQGSLLWLPPDERSAGEIYVMNRDGTGVTRLTNNRTGEGSPAWRPAASH